jgi:hypothetical protein
VRKAFRDLREYPPEQRGDDELGQFQAQFTPQERSILGNILAVEPYQPDNTRAKAGQRAGVRAIATTCPLQAITL